MQSSEVSRPPDNRNTAAVSSILVAPECWILLLIDPLRDPTLALRLAQLGLAALVQLVLILEAPRLDLGVRGLPQLGVDQVGIIAQPLEVAERDVLDGEAAVLRRN